MKFEITYVCICQSFVKLHMYLITKNIISCKLNIWRNSFVFLVLAATTLGQQSFKRRRPNKKVPRPAETRLPRSLSGSHTFQFCRKWQSASGCWRWILQIWQHNGSRGCLEGKFGSGNIYYIFYFSPLNCVQVGNSFCFCFFHIPIRMCLQNTRISCWNWN